MEEIEAVSYRHHVSEQQQIRSTERRHEIVKKLLEKLPESERTVVTLYYLGEMTTKEISKFLGVSAKTISSRLTRARKRLKEKEDLFVQEFLGGVQLSTNLKQNIMQQVADLNPTSIPVGKPLLPWVALGATGLLVILMLSVSNQYLARFQKPYSFEAVSEPTIEIIEAPIVLDIDAKPALRNQVGRADTPNKSSSANSQTSERDATPNTTADSRRLSGTQWMPDTALRQAIRETLKIPAHLPMTPADLQRLTVLDVREKGIVDLTGLEHATHLHTLVLIENKIHDISPLSGLTQLSFLDLGGNQISDLRPLTTLTLLESLRIWRNKIEDISPLTALVNLKSLLIENNDIKDFSPLDELTQLEVLHRHGNFRVCDDDISRVAVASRVNKDREYPSIFSAWYSDIPNLPNLSADETIIYHDLFWGGLGFELQWHPTSEGLRLFGRIDDAHWKRQYLLSKNPNFLRLVSLDYTDADPQDILIQKAIAVAKCGLYDGIFLDGWQEDRVPLDNDADAHYQSVEAEQSTKVSVVRRIREAADDDFLIIVNTERSKAQLAAPYVNGMFMETMPDERDTGYTHDGLREIESTLLWSEQNFREPQISTLEGRGIPLEPPDSPRNQQMMRVITTLSLTHSDGYVCYVTGIENGTHVHEYELWSQHKRDHTEGKSHHHNHQHYWYDFWDADLGQPIGEKSQLYQNREGLFIREFTNGWVIYNRSGKEQKIRLPEQASGVASGITGINHTISDLDGEIYLK